jgi:exopolysaccharide biosynthesis polyprenyl glycosylphosphotransferase
VAIILGLVEGGVLFAAVCATIFVWARPLLVDWIDMVIVLSQAIVLSLCCIVAFYYNDLYDLRIVRSFGGFASRLVQAFGVAFILLAGCYVLFPQARIAEEPFISSVLLTVSVVLPIRALTYGFMRSRPFTERVVILGTGSLARKLIDEIEAQPQVGYAIVAVVDDAVPADLSRYPCFGPVAQLGKILDEVRADRVITALAERRGRLPVRELLEERMRGLLVEDGLEAYEHLTGKLALESITPSNLLFSRNFHRSRLSVTLARGLSLLVALVGLVVTVPLMCLIALTIKVDSHGPVLFVQERMGLRGQRFRLLKFRTMVSDGGPSSEWVQDNEDRITRVGRWLRMFRFDELPQFINIVRGHMNLVGPRPHPASNVALFAERIPYYALRSSVRPGVTGWAQVRYGYANNLGEEIEKMRYDLHYIKHFSVWFDLRILVDTVKIVLFGRGSRIADAYRVEPIVGRGPAASLTAALGGRAVEKPGKRVETPLRRRA